MSLNWIWSPPHQDYYYVTYDGNGQAIYHWAKKPQASAPQPNPAIPRTRVDSVTYPHSQDYYPSNGSDLVPPEPASEDTRRRHPDLIPGTPHLGWSESLDPSYAMRTGQEARLFFRKGRVFSMLYSEAASQTRNTAGSDDAFSLVKFNEYVHSQIRRFVIVDVRRHFVYACAISTYSGRGTAKPGCDPDEHCIVFLRGTAPQYVSGEYKLRKEPIEIEPAHSGISMSPASRLRFGKIYPIEWNVKVKDIGMVVPEDLSKLILYWKEEDQNAQ